MYIDTTVTHQAGRHSVLAHCCGVFWPGAGQVVLHAVHVRGVLDRFLRAFELRPGSGRWAVVDLRDLLPRSFEGDIKAAPARDDDGLAAYALRTRYRSATEFINAAQAKAYRQHDTRMAA